MRMAQCRTCGGYIFIIFEDMVTCAECESQVEFEFTDDSKIICTTHANDLVKAISEL